MVALTLAAAGRAALVLLAFAPLLWLAYDLGLGYHAAALAATGAYGLAGLAALGVVLRGLGRRAHAITTALAFVAVFVAAGGQTGWILRPYLLRPQTEGVPFLRSVEGGFADAIVRSSRSAIGVYDEAEREIVHSARAASAPPMAPPVQEGWRDPALEPMQAPNGWEDEEPWQEPEENPPGTIIYDPGGYR